ncbi:hypothetical protein HYT01_02245 [Candidatus Giovannonibacteria bacterium]|nr:hypothetical protein [Candidatus Giovannonibacteria bacterium]
METIICESSTSLQLPDGATIEISIFRHMTKIEVQKDNANVHIIIGREKNNNIRVETEGLYQNRDRI